MRQSNDRQVGVRGRRRQTERDGEEGSTVSVVKTKDKWRALPSRKLKVRNKRKKKKNKTTEKACQVCACERLCASARRAHKRIKKSQNEGNEREGAEKKDWK